jgi:DNA-binding beta-propeller fold protein YncE
LDFAPNGNLYVADQNNHRIQYFTSGGSFLGKWGSYGEGEGEFDKPRGVTVAPNGDVFVADNSNDRVQYFTSSGSYLGVWGKRGTGPGEFWATSGLDFSSTGNRLYVVDVLNYRIQYFCEATTIVPSSLGRVKALFR